MNAKKPRARIPQENKVRALLQQEISSQCPLCDDTDVGYFEIHHIDGDRSNNDLSNLILICTKCHSKIHKGDILREEVELAKRNTGTSRLLVEVAAVTVQSSECAWIARETVPNAFYSVDSGKSPFPILSISCINHSKKTILLTGIHLRTFYHPSGLGGLPEPRVLKPTHRYRISIFGAEEGKKVSLEEQIEIPAEQAFRFEIELIEEIGGEVYAPEEQMVLYLTLLFNSSMEVKVPNIYLNCESEHTGHQQLSILE